MSTAVEKQLRQRRAVFDALARKKVHIASRRYREGEAPVYRILVSGRYYDVGDAVLSQLADNVTPEDLELEAVAEDGPDAR